MHVARRNSNFRKMASDFSDPPIAQIGENEALKIIGVFKSLNLSQFQSFIACKLIRMKMMSVKPTDWRRLVK